MADEIKKNNKHLINAPAGSGKTTYIRNQLKSICINKPESRILCITYTNRAADELKKDLENANITVSTIHSYINDLISPFYSHKEVLDLYCEIYAEKINERIANVTKNKFDKIIEIYEKDGCLIREVIESLFDNGFIPEKVKNDFEENIEYQKVLDIEMKEVSNLANYLSMPHISTQHGVKGESHMIL